MTLIERLRESMRGSDICNEAADMIEQLEKQRDELLNVIEDFVATGYWNTEILHDAIATVKAQCKKSRRDNDEYRVATTEETRKGDRT